jgi:outer membrane PBP1 activator LpoA protein
MQPGAEGIPGHRWTSQAVLLLVVMLVLMISGCAMQQPQQGETAVQPQEESRYKYAAWRPEPALENGAINALLSEADILIENAAYDAAADKIERVLRIKPDYAAAWSRLSWLALQANSPERCVLMAKRSNSLAQSNPELQSLNWSFIRAASRVLNDEDAFDRANQKIESLKAF